MITTTNDARISVAVYGLMLLVLVYIGRLQELIPHLDHLQLGKVSIAISILLFIVSRRANQFNSTAFIQVRYVIGIFIMAFVSVPFSAWPGGSVNFITDSLLKTGLFFFLLISVITEVKEIERILWAVIYSVFFLSLAVMFAAKTGRETASSTYDPNDLAFVMTTFLPLVYYYMKQKTGFIKLFLLLVAILMVMAILATVSRGGLLGILVISGAIYLKQGKSLKQMVLPAIILAIVFSLFASESYWERMSTLLNPGQDYNVTDSGGRIEIWKRGLKMIVNRPLNGNGINVFEVAEGGFHGGVGKWSSPHNSFIQIGAELGVIGLIIFVKLIKSSIQAVRKLNRYKKDGPIPSWLLDGVEVAFYGYITTGFFLSQAYSSVLFFLVALTVVIEKIARKNTEFKVLTNVKEGYCSTVDQGII